MGLTGVYHVHRQTILMQTPRQPIRQRACLKHNPLVCSRNASNSDSGSLRALPWTNILPVSSITQKLVSSFDTSNQRLAHHLARAIKRIFEKQHTLESFLWVPLIRNILKELIRGLLRRSIYTFQKRVVPFSNFLSGVPQQRFGMTIPNILETH